MTIEQTTDLNTNSQQQEPANESSKASVEANPQDNFSATYSPDDNKLRLTSVYRLDAETFERLKKAGFKWAPKQGVFYAQMWTPDREDLLIELAGSIEDEDTTLAERAEERAERFADYSDKRMKEADAARKSVDSIVEHIPLGQPILIGHHSERKARRDADRITRGMRKSVDLWETSTYWKQRAAGALAHAKYKELPAVRHRRIKGIETDLRKQLRHIKEAEASNKLWSRPELTAEQALHIANFDSINIRNEDGSWTSLWSLLSANRITPAEAAERAIRAHERSIKRSQRWVTHYNHRLEYERAMLGEQGGIAADAFDIVAGGMVLVRGEWVTVLRVTKREGRINSVTTNARYGTRVSIECVKDYRPPAEGAVEAVKAAIKAPPIVNLPGEGHIEMTKAEWSKIHRDYKGTRKVEASEASGAHRVRTVVQHGYLKPVYLTDTKRVELPAPTPAVAPLPREAVAPVVKPAAPAEKEPNAFEDLAERLKAGVELVASPLLYPTPADVAARMVELSGLRDGQSVLEPSAGTGALLEAVRQAGIASVQTIFEIDYRLCNSLRLRFDGVSQCDFLQVAPDHHRKHDAVLMNPPFNQAADIVHIKHALQFLKPGGTLVAICAGGPRQAEQLRPMAEASGGIWEPLPDDTFKAAGTSVRSFLLTIHR